MWDRVLNMIREGKLDYVDSRGIVDDIPGPYPTAQRGTPAILRERTGYVAAWNELVVRHSPIISHPDTVSKIIEAIGPRGQAIAVLVGTGYWAWLLKQRGIKIAAYDDRRLWGPRTWLDQYGGIIPLDRHCRIIQVHTHEPMLLTAPTDERRAVAALKQYIGPKVIFAGPRPRRGLAEILEQWEMVDEYRPVYHRREPFTVAVYARGRAVGWNQNTTLFKQFSPPVLLPLSV
jgi:hypothetical protein